MKVSFESQLLLDPAKTGIGWMADEMIRAIRKLEPDWELQLNYFKLRDRKNGHPAVMQEYGKQNMKLKSVFFSYTAYKMMWNVIRIPYSWFFGKDSDVTFFFNYYIPPGVKGRKVTIFYDMNYKVFPETVRFRTKMMLQLNMRAAARRADRILVISEFTRQEVLRYMNVDPDKLLVVPCGVKLDKFRPDLPEEAVREMRNRLQLPERYLLYLGTLEPRKNIERMIAAYAKACEKDPEFPVLVLAGRKGWMYDTIFRQVKDLGLEERTIFTGYVADGDAPLLMKGAEVFLFPSLYEGFGMPPLEAMACGTPVLTSDAASLPEVTGDAAVLVDPLNVDEMADAIGRLVHDKPLRERLSQAGPVRAAGFTWERSAKLVTDLFRDMMHEQM